MYTYSNYIPVNGTVKAIEKKVAAFISLMELNLSDINSVRFTGSINDVDMNNTEVWAGLYVRDILRVFDNEKGKPANIKIKKVIGSIKIEFK